MKDSLALIEASEKQTVLHISQQVKDSLEKQSQAHEAANESAQKLLLLRQDSVHSRNDEIKDSLHIISDYIADVRSVVNVLLSSVSSGSVDVMRLLTAIRSEQKSGTDDIRLKLSSFSRSPLINRDVDAGPSVIGDDSAAIPHVNESFSSSFSHADELNEKLNDMTNQLNESVIVGNVVLANVAAYSSDGILSALNEFRDGNITSGKAMISRLDSLESLVSKLNKNVDEVRSNSLESNLVIASRLENLRKTVSDMRKVLTEKVDDNKTTVIGLVQKLLDDRSAAKSETPSVRSDLSSLESKIDEFDSRSKKTQEILEPFVASETEQRSRERGNLSAIAETVCEIQAMLAMHARTPQRVPHSASRSSGVSRLETPK